MQRIKVYTVFILFSIFFSCTLISTGKYKPKKFGDYEYRIIGNAVSGGYGYYIYLDESQINYKLLELLDCLIKEDSVEIRNQKSTAFFLFFEKNYNSVEVIDVKAKFTLVTKLYNDEYEIINIGYPRQDGQENEINKAKNILTTYRKIKCKHSLNNEK